MCHTYVTLLHCDICVLFVIFFLSYPNVLLQPQKFPGLKITASPVNDHGQAFVNFSSEADAAMFVAGTSAGYVRIDGKVIVAKRKTLEVASAPPCRFGAKCRNIKDGSCIFQHPR